MVQLLVLIVVFTLASLVCTDRAEPIDRSTTQSDEYDDEYQYDDAEDSYRFEGFGQKNFNQNQSAINFITNHEIRTFRPSTTKLTTTTHKSTPRAAIQFSKRQRTPTGTVSPTKTTQVHPESSTYKTSWSYKGRTTKKSSTTQAIPVSSTTKLIYDYSNSHVEPSSTIRSTKLVDHRRRQPISNTISSKFKELPHKTTNASNENSSKEQLENSESSPGFVTDTFSVNSHPFNEYSFSTYHYDRRKPSSVNKDSDEERVIFTTDITDPKYVINNGNFGYFKPKRRKPMPSQSDTSEFTPVHPDFLSDLSVATLPLESYPSHLKYYNQDGVGIEHTSYEADEGYFSGHHGDYGKEKTYDHHNPPASPPSTKSVASREQIDLYNDDIRKQKIEHQLRTSSNLADKGKYHQFLKAQQDERVERIEQQTKREQRPRNRPHYHHRLPHQFHNKHHHQQNHGKPGLRKHHERPISTLGLGHFRTTASDRASYHYPFI